MWQSESHMLPKIDWAFVIVLIMSCGIRICGIQQVIMLPKLDEIQSENDLEQKLEMKPNP